MQNKSKTKDKYKGNRDTMFINNRDKKAQEREDPTIPKPTKHNSNHPLNNSEE